jgi:hypothetical protein
MPTTTLNTTNLAPEFTARTSALGRQPKVLAVKDSALEATARTVLATGVVGAMTVVVDAALAASEWVLRLRPDVEGPNSAATRAVLAKAADHRRHSFLPPGTPFPYGG